MCACVCVLWLLHIMSTRFGGNVFVNMYIETLLSTMMGYMHYVYVLYYVAYTATVVCMCV